MFTTPLQDNKTPINPRTPNINKQSLLVPAVISLLSAEILVHQWRRFYHKPRESQGHQLLSSLNIATPTTRVYFLYYASVDSLLPLAPFSYSPSLDILVNSTFIFLEDENLVISFKSK